MVAITYPNAPRELDASDPQADEPRGFNGILKPPQATLLYRMLQMEASHGEDQPLGTQGRWICTCVARISEPFSFGKTVLSIALVLAARTAPQRPLPVNLAMNHHTLHACSRSMQATMLGSLRSQYLGTRHHRPYGPVPLMPTAECWFSHMIPCTLVIASNSVISQWEDNIRRFGPTLQFFTIDDVRSLQTFEQLYQTGAVRHIDLVLLKNGKVTNNFRAGWEKPANIPLEGIARPLTAALTAVTQGCVWGRTIWDDYDTVSLSYGDVMIPSYFTWVISATSRHPPSTRYPIPAPMGESASLGEDLYRWGWAMPVRNFSLSLDLENWFSLRCLPEYTRESYRGIPAPFYQQYRVRGGRVARMMNALGVPAEVAEMLNGDAMDTAAEMLGIKCDTPQALFRRLLSDQLNQYRRAVHQLDVYARALRGARAQPPTNIQPSQTAVRLYVQELKASTPASCEAVLQRSPPYCRLLDALLHEQTEKATKRKELYGTRLERLRGNLREESCQVCLLPLGEGGDGTYVTGCCQLALCSTCTTEDAHGRRQFVKNCPNCQAAINPKKDLIYLSINLELDQLLEDSACVDGDGVEDADEPDAADSTYIQSRPKLQVLVDLLCGRPVECLESGPGRPIEGLLETADSQPGETRRTLVFAYHPESVRIICAGLEHAQVPHLRLQGTRLQKKEIVDRYRSPEGPHVMVVTASRDCAGLHLPETDRLVFYHQILDMNVRQQVAGRAQRLGRTHSLEIVYIYNEAEVEDEEE